MSFTASSIIPSYISGAVWASVHSLGVSVKKDFNAITKKIKDAATSPAGVIGFGLGVGMHRISEPLTEKIIKFLGVSTTLPDPFSSLGLRCQILLMPFICILGPTMEEIMFREDIQGTLKDKLHFFYVNLSLSDSDANIASRVTSVFFVSVIFGLVHFTNAIIFWCNPVFFLSQVVAAIMGGLMLGLAKEFSGELHMPIGMHIGNNTFDWIRYIKTAL